MSILLCNLRKKTSCTIVIHEESISEWEGRINNKRKLRKLPFLFAKGNHLDMLFATVAISFAATANNKALSTAVFLIYCLLSIVIDVDSPFFRLFKTQPDYSDLLTFGCVFCSLTSVKGISLEHNLFKCAFMGYSNSHKGFVRHGSLSNETLFLPKKFTNTSIQ